MVITTMTITTTTTIITIIIIIIAIIIIIIIHHDMQVKYEVRETNIGKGLFLLEPVGKGTLIWRWMAIILYCIRCQQYHVHGFHHPRD